MSAIALDEVQELEPLARLTAGNVMTRDLVTVPVDATLGDAMTAMRRSGVRHLPVTRGGCFVGLLDDRAVAFALLGSALLDDVLDRPVDEVMVRYVAQVDPSAPMPRVARLLRTSGCDAVVVVDAADHLLGLITMVDVVGSVGAL